MFFFLKHGVVLIASVHCRLAFRRVKCPTQINDACIIRFGANNWLL